MASAVTKNVPPSAGWTSYDGWDYNGMKESLERFMSIINKSSLVEHTQLIIGQLGLAQRSLLCWAILVLFRTPNGQLPAYHSTRAAS